MTLPGFNAETSLYETRAHYRSTGASVQTNGIMLQKLQIPSGTCGPCLYDFNLGCARNCTSCIFGPCINYTEPCSSCVIPSEGVGGDCPCETFGGLCICPPPTVLM